jgi:hypothetical protein
MELIDKFDKDAFGNDTLQYTTDPLVKYDWLGEEYIVALDDKTCAMIYGGNRSLMAEKIADFVRSEDKGEV